MQSLNKLRWRCRRGTLELDLMLQRYLETSYVSASQAEQNSFLQLLRLEDTEILPWLMGDRIPEQPELAALVKKIRKLAAVSEHLQP